MNKEFEEKLIEGQRSFEEAAERVKDEELKKIFKIYASAFEQMGLNLEVSLLIKRLEGYR